MHHLSSVAVRIYHLENGSVNVVKEFEKNTANNLNSNISSISMQKVHSVAHNSNVCESSTVTATK